jgi:hypothetical protein
MWGNFRWENRFVALIKKLISVGEILNLNKFLINQLVAIHKHIFLCKFYFIALCLVKCWDATRWLLKMKMAKLH